MACQGCTRGRTGPLDGGFGWFVVVGSFVVHFVALGVLYSFGVYYLPIAEEFGASRGTTAWVAGLNLLIFSLACFPSGRLVSAVGTQSVVAMGGVVVGISLVLSSYATSLVQLCLSYGALTGIGFALAWVPCITAVQLWFDVKRGMAAGLAVAGSGAGNFVFPIFLESFISSHGWRATMRVEGLVVAAAILVVAPLLVSRVETLQPAMSEVQLAKFPAEQAADDHEVRLQTTSSTRALSAKPPQEMEKQPVLRDLASSRTYRLLVVGMFFGELGYGIPFFHVVPYASDLGLSDSDAALILGVFGLASLSGRVLLGSAADVLGRVNVLVAAVAIMGICTILWPLAFKSLPTLVFYASLYGFNAGAFISLPPALVAEHVPSSLLSMAIGLLFTLSSVPSMMAPVIGGLFFDKFGSYVWTGVFAGGGLLVCAILWCWLPGGLAAKSTPSEVHREQTESMTLDRLVPTTVQKE